MLLELIEKHQKVGLIMKTHHAEELAKILRDSPLDPNGVNYTHESIYLAAHKLTARPKCLVCNNIERRFHNIKKGYVPTCNSCKGKSDWRQQKFHATCEQRYGAKTPAENKVIMDKIHKTKTVRGHFKTPDQRTAYQEYTILVQGLTQKQPLHLLENFDRRGKSGALGAYQVDHQFSIYDGFKNQVPAETVAHLSNLKMLPATENRKKWHRSVITLGELLARISETK